MADQQTRMALARVWVAACALDQRRRETRLLMEKLLMLKDCILADDPLSIVAEIAVARKEVPHA